MRRFKTHYGRGKGKSDEVTARPLIQRHSADPQEGDNDRGEIGSGEIRRFDEPRQDHRRRLKVVRDRSEGGDGRWDGLRSAPGDAAMGDRTAGTGTSRLGRTPGGRRATDEKRLRTRQEQAEQDGK